MKSPQYGIYRHDDDPADSVRRARKLRRFHLNRAYPSGADRKALQRPYENEERPAHTVRPNKGRVDAALRAAGFNIPSAPNPATEEKTRICTQCGESEPKPHKNAPLFHVCDECFTGVGRPC